MKRQKNAEELAARLTAGATTPLQMVLSTVEETAAKEIQQSKSKKGTVAVFLRLPEEIHNRLDARAVAATKESGRGVSIQQIITEILEREL